MMPSSKVRADANLECLKTADLFTVIAKLKLMLCLSVVSDTTDSYKVMYTRTDDVTGVIVMKVLNFDT